MIDLEFRLQMTPPEEFQTFPSRDVSDSVLYNKMGSTIFRTISIQRLLKALMSSRTSSWIAFSR
jgi:hypothetical protein